MPIFETKTVVGLGRNMRLSFYVEAALTGLGAAVDRFRRSRPGKSSTPTPSQVPAPSQQVVPERAKKSLGQARAKPAEQRRELKQARQQLASKDQELEQARQQLASKDQELEQAHQQLKSQELEEQYQLAKMREEYHQLAEDFYERALDKGYGDLRKYFWYHTIDLGDGLVTPGSYDYRSSLPAFKFPADMEGMNVLDVGSATGFFAFEFERRGANVTSVELPSLPADAFPGEESPHSLEFVEEEQKKHEEWTEERAHLLREGTAEEQYHFLTDGPFKFCYKVLNSKLQRCYSSIYDLSKENLGRDDFDLVFLGDILVHTIDPLKALAAVAPLCQGTLIVAQDLPNVSPNVPDPHPAMLYIGGDEPGEHKGAWWLPNRLWFEQVLRKLGFKEMSVVGEHTGLIRPGGVPYKRAIIHATKNQI